MSRLITAITVFGLLASSQALHAEIVSKPVSYTHGDAAFEGYIAYNRALGDDQPTVVIVHDWDGLGEYERMRARMLAHEGYAAFAIDLFGEGVRPESIERRRELTGALYADRDRMRALIDSGMDAAFDQRATDIAKMVAIGYCFGGAVVLEMARAGLPLEGFVSFHGGLGTPEGQDYTDVQGELLILHGSNDAVAPMEDISSLADRLDADGVDYQIEIYGGARHAFTDWEAEDRYDPQADLKSWQALRTFLGDTLN
ncbi:dienelactone hydrolase family protein [Spiribacter sp. 221]|uniref:dienelactone hydrolase family protein n=1 Tax=Spiribacter onubensis TaxID=3122420 RepID=UPI00349F30C0